MFACCTATFLVSERSLTSIRALRQCKTLANSNVCASAKPCQLQKFVCHPAPQCKTSKILWSCASAKAAPVQKLHGPRRQHYNFINLVKSSVFIRDCPGSMPSHQPIQKAPNLNKLGAFVGRFDKFWVNCREGGRFGDNLRKLDLFSNWADFLS